MKELSSALQIVPNAATDVIALTSWVFQIVVANVTGGAVTLQILDKAASPLQLVPTVSLAANSSTVWNFPEGVKMTGGIRWVAGAATSLHASIVSYSVVA